MKEVILSQLNQEPDITLAELIDVLKLPIQKSQLSEWIIQNGYAFKKTLFANKDRFTNQDLFL